MDKNLLLLISLAAVAFWYFNRKCDGCKGGAMAIPDRVSKFTTQPTSSSGTQVLRAKLSAESFYAPLASLPKITVQARRQGGTVQVPPGLIVGMR